VTDPAPNVNGVPVAPEGATLFPLTKENPLLAAGTSEDGLAGWPKENAGLMSPAGGGVLGAAPKEKGPCDVLLSGIVSDVGVLDEG